MKLKRSFAVILAVVLITALAVPSLALGSRAITENTEYIKEQTAVIGRPGYALTVRGDGSFYLGNESNSVAVIFGAKTSTAEVSFEDSYYPVSTHRYNADGLNYTVSQFVYGADGETICVYSRMTVKNNTQEAVAFPEVSTTVAISGLPEKIAAGKSATVDFQTVIAYGAEDVDPTASTTGSNLSYDEAKGLMIAFWDSYLSGKLSVEGIEKDNAAAYDNYKKALIYDSIGIHEYTAYLALSSIDSAKTVFSSTDDLYSAAVALSKTGDTVVAVFSLESFTPLAESYSLKDGKLPFKTLEENLDALLSLQSYAYILKAIAKTDDTYTAAYDEAKATASEFADCISAAIKDTESKLPCDWEAATTDSSYPLVLNGEGFASASALSAWYSKSSVFSDIVSKELVSLAKDSVEYCTAVADSTSALLSLISQREDGTIIIGRGAPFSVLSENALISLDNFILASGTNAGLTITVDNKNIQISLSGAISSPIQIEFPAFAGYIEYASTGFDSDSGVVTVPEGTTNISIRLSNSLSSIEKDRKATSDLEAAIAAAYEKKVDNPTSVSKEILDSALKKAEKARSATRDEKVETTSALITATEKLSPTVAGYTYVSSESNETLGTITKDEIYQKFDLPSSGTVTSLYVAGEYADGISVAVYTLRGDLYTTDELCAEAYGEAADGGITFDVEFEVLGGITYVLCIFSESGDVSLSLEKTDGNTAYITELGETIVFNSASLDFEICVRQADRSALDTFYSACLEADLSGYTKESQKTLKNRMNDAKTHLCTPSATEEEYNRIYDNLKKAYDGLDTYASEDKIEEAPIIGIVLIAVVIILLAATLLTSLAARKRMNSDK